MKNRTILAGFVMLLMVLTTFAVIPANDDGSGRGGRG